MFAYLTTPVRAALLAAALAGPVQTVAAHATADRTQTTSAPTTARTTADAGATDRDGVPLGGLLLIVGIVGAVIFFAWVASRIGDNNRPMMT